ncbi:MAG TPA: LD-carboxypeptidase [Nitrospiria bacterium]
MIKPRALKKGDTIGVVAPAGLADKAELERGMARLVELGYKVKRGSSLKGRLRYMAGEDRERAEDINRMFSDPSVRAILCARGGYGTLRMMPFLDEAVIRKHPKIFVGSSDLTILLNHLHQKIGLVPFHGPMVAPNFGRNLSELTEASFSRVLGGEDQPELPPNLGVRVLRPGKARGPLVGGCLSILCSSLGTPYEIKTKDAVLLLEDVNEAPYRIDRMLTQLKAAGKLKGVKGVVIGTMPGCDPPLGAGYWLDDVFGDVLREVPGPVIYGFPAGHGGEQVTLPLGVEVKLDGAGPSVTLAESPVEPGP